MTSLPIRYFLPYLLLPLVIRGKETIINEELTEDTRQSRASGRIVKLYSGTRPEPIVCSNEGFKADPHDCTVFYRCMKSGSGKYTIFRFKCGPGTIYDIDKEVCNHPRSTKRSECGDFNVPSIEENDNEIENYNQEVPKPLSTKLPVYFTTTVKTSMISLTTSSSKPNEDSQNLDTANEITNIHESVVSAVPMTTTNHNDYKNNATVEYSSSSPIKLEAVTASHGLNSQSNICVSEGFMGDSENCHKFYRCVGNQRGGFMKFDFLCSELTVWDDEIQACNHPWAVKRSRCGRSSLDSNSVQIKPVIKDSHIGAIHTTTSNFTGNGTINSSQVIHISPVSQSTVKINNDELKQTEDNSIEQNHPQTNYGVDSQIPTKIDKDIFQPQRDKFKQPSQKEEENTTNTKVPIMETESMPKINSLCVQTGFLGDLYDCKKFYRCVDTGKGNFIKYEFSCGESTVWDPKLEACNHVWAVPRCGGNFMPTTQIDVVETSPPSSSNTSTPSAPVIQTTIEIDAEEQDVGYGNINSSVKTTTLRTTNVASSPQILPLNDCKSSGFKGDSKDCSIFYRCVENANGGYTKYEFKCSQGTVWDSNLEACNYAGAVKTCGENESTVENIPTTTETTNISNNPTTALNGNLSTTTEIFQPDQEDSGYISNIEEIASVTTKLPDSPMNGSSECKSNGFLGDKNNCKKFYRCVNNGDGSFDKYEFTCGEGTVWDSKIEACNHAWAVESCGGVSESNTSEYFDLVSTISPQFTTTNKVENSNIESTGNTTLVSVLFSTTTTETAALAANTCKSSGFIGDQKDCKKFYRCVDNGDGTFTRFEFNCGEGTVWDSKIGNCNHAWAVEKCGEHGEGGSSNAVNTSDSKPTLADEYDNGEATTSKTTTSEKPNFIQTTVSTQIVNTICKESGFIVDKNDCQKFYRCVDDGKGGFLQFDYRCGEGTVWDSSIEACNHVWAAQECKFDKVTNETIENSTHVLPSTSAVQGSQNSTLPSVINTVTTTTEKSLSDYCTQEGFIGDQVDCKTFYRCVYNSQGGFIKYEFRCGEGTFWNQEIQACDHVSENKRCYSPSYEIVDNKPQIENDEIYTEAMTETTSTSHSPIVTEKPTTSENTCQNEGFFGDSSDCQKFYRCVEDSKDVYTKYEFICGAGTIWNQDITACDHPSSENKCLSENINPSSNHTNESNQDGESSDITSTLKPHSTREPENSITATTADTDECISEGFYGNSHDCRKFFRCVLNDKGTFAKYDFICGTGTIWVQEIQACDHNNGIETCTSINTPETTTVAYASTTSQSSSNTTPLLSTPIKNDDKYYTSTKKPTTEECVAEGFFGNDNDCKKFYRCVENGQGGYIKYDFSCGEGTAWDVTIEGCNHIDNVKNCNFSHQEGNQTQPILFDEMPSNENEQGTTKVPSSSQTTESSISDAKANCESEGYFGDTEDCKIFYRCVDNGKDGFSKYEFTCGEGTIWDQDLTTCNHPQDVSKPSCGHTSEYISTSSTMSSSSSDSLSGTSTLSTTASTTEIGDITSTNSSQESSNKPNQDITCPKEGFYPNPQDCKKFYRCVDWDGDGQRFSVYHFECADGTIWDPALNTCNHEESVYPPRDCSSIQSESQITEQETTTEEQVQESSTQTTIVMISTTNEETTTQQTSTTQKTTATEETTISEEPTTQKTTTLHTSSESTHTTVQSTTQQQSSTEISTSQTHEQTTTQQTTTQLQTSTSTASTTQQPTSLQTTTDQTTENSISDQTTSTTNTTTTTSESSSTEISTTSDTVTTEQSTNQESNSTQMTTTLADVSTTTDPTQSTTSETASITEVSQELTTTEENSSTINEGPTEVSTQVTGTESSTIDMETSTEGNTDSNCPNTEDDQHLFVCPTSFRRHPKYCNIFYQCTEDDETHEIKIATFNCPNNTIYDESQTKCVEQDKANVECDGEISSRRRLKHLSINYKEPIIVTRDSQSCSSEGHMPFEKNSECSPAFLKCEKSKHGRLRGIVHQCPQNYVYWSISRRCERVERVRDCKRTTNNWNGRWEIPIDKHNVAW